MAREVKNKKALFALAGVAVLALVGGAFALNYTRFVMGNDFNLGYFKTEFAETFESPTDWTPCDQTEKLVTIKNTGNMDSVARIALDESWKNESGANLSPILDGNRLAVLEIASGWTLRDGYYYYDGTIEPGEKVTFLKSVTFNCNSNIAQNEICDGLGNCTKSGLPGYSNATYRLVVKAQVMQDDPNVSWHDAFEGYREPQTFALMQPGLGSRLSSLRSSANVYVNKLLRSEVLPDDLPMGQYAEVQASGETPVIFWVDRPTKAIYWYSEADAITLSPNDSLGGWFGNSGSGPFYEKAVDISGMTYFDTKNLPSMGGFFYGNFLPDDMSAISHWDVSGVTSWGGVFNSTYGGCYTSASPNNYCFTDNHMSGIEHWKINNASSLSGMISGNSAVTNLSGFANWDTSGMTSLASVFSGMSNLQNISAIGNWDVHNVTNIASLFAGSWRITDVSALGRWQFDNLQQVGSMFGGVSSLSNISGIGNWDMSHVTSLSSLFSGERNITDFSTLANWDVSNVTDFGSMFSGTVLDTLAPFANWNTGSATNVASMFSGTLVSDATPISGWDVSGVTSFNNMFASTKINSVSPLAGWDVSAGESFNGMFYSTEFITDATPLNGWAVDPDATLTDMFKYANCPESLYPTWYTPERRG